MGVSSLQQLNGAPLGPSPVVQNLLHKRSQEAISNLPPASRKDKEIELRALRSKLGVKCSGCGRVGYYRVNCPSCDKVVIDVRQGDWKEPETEIEAR